MTVAPVTETEVPGSPDPAFQRPLNPPEIEAAGPVAVLPAAPAPDHQAALFEDPLRLLALDVADLRLLGVEVARESGSVLARVRRANGLVAWAMWYQSTELAYADWERAHAEDIQTPPTTLRRWRRDVVEAGNLPMPAVAAARAAATNAALSSRAPRKTAGQAGGSTTGGMNNTRSELAPGVAASGPRDPLLQPARLPDPGPPPTVRAAIAHLIDHLHALDPDEAGAAMTAAQLDLVMDWTERTVKAAPRRGRKKSGEGEPRRRPGPGGRAEGGSTPPAANGSRLPSPDCSHPITRRERGTGRCYECGQVVKK